VCVCVCVGLKLNGIAVSVVGSLILTYEPKYP